MISPAKNDEQWSSLLVAGTRSPGVVTLSGDGLKFGWDVQSASGQMGGITRRTGDPVREFDAEFYLVDEEDAAGQSDFDRWDAFQALLKSAVGGQGKKPRALDIFHPDLARCEITAATVGSIGLMALDGKGGGRIKVHFLEYKPPKPIKPLPSTKTEGDKMIDQVNAQIAEEQTKYKKLSEEGEPKKSTLGDAL